MKFLTLKGNKNMTEIILRPDAKGKLNLGELAQNVSSYRVTIEDHGRLILTPYTEIPFSDKWIFENKAFLEKIKKEYQSNDHILNNLE